MRYTILLHYPELMAAGELNQAAIEEGQAAFHRYAADLDKAGVLISAEVLQPSSSTTTLAAIDGKLPDRGAPECDPLGERLLDPDVTDADEVRATAALAARTSGLTRPLLSTQVAEGTDGHPVHGHEAPHRVLRV